MRILHIISSLASGGAEVYVRDLAKQMVQDGHEVCIGYISDAKSIRRSSEYEDDFKSQLKKTKVQWIEIGHDCRTRVWRGGVRIHKIVADFKPDVIHSHLYYGLIFKALAFVNVPTVYTHHNHYLGKGKYLYPIFNRIVSCFIGISRDCTISLQSVGAKAVTTIYNGVSVERLLIKEKYNDKNDHINIQAVGTLGAQKNFELLISALENLLKRRTKLRNLVSLKIAGEGPLLIQLQEQIDRANLSKQLTLLGNSKDVSVLLHEADLFVMSSDYEGLPIALLEAMMTGLPVIVTDVGGCRDVVEVCNAGFIVPSNNVRALADALEFMIDNPTERSRMAKNAKKNSIRFNIKTACEQHLSMYKSLL